MNKREFLEKLEERLSYDLPQQLVREKISFYEDYINDEVSKGKNPEDVIKDIGDPVLIARTIVDSLRCGADGIPNTDDDIDFRKEMYGNGTSSGYGRNSYGNSSENGYGRRTYDENGQSSEDGDSDKRHSMKGRFVPLIAMIVIMFLFMAVLTFFGTVISFAAPVIMPFFVIMLVMWLIRRR